MNSNGLSNRFLSTIMFQKGLPIFAAENILWAEEGEGQKSDRRDHSSPLPEVIEGLRFLRWRFSAAFPAGSRKASLKFRLTIFWRLLPYFVLILSFKCSNNLSSKLKFVVQRLLSLSYLQDESVIRRLAKSGGLFLVAGSAL